MGFSFEKLRVWQDALNLTEEITELVKSFPESEKFILISQIKRAADSIALNIAEGSTGQTKPEYRRFLSMSLRSCIEVVGCLHLAKKRKFINETHFNYLFQNCELLVIKIQALRNSLKE
jgi:four helix bundle protein